MNTPSRCLAGLTRIAGAALVLLALAVPRAFAIELKVVGDNTPIDAGQNCGHITDPFTDCYLAQAFSLSSGAYVNQVNVSLIANPTSPDSSTAGFELLIVRSVIDCPTNPFVCWGTVQLDRVESVVVPRSPVADQLIPFADSFPAIFLPKGTYYLIFVTGAPVETRLTWAPNQVGSSEAGILGQAFCTTGGGCQSGAPWTWQPLTTNPTQPPNLAGTNGTFAFELDGPLAIPSGGGGFGQILRLVAGPVRVAPGVPVEATLGFLDTNGNQIGPTSTVSLGPGQIQSLDLNLTPLVNRSEQHVEVQPFIAAAPSATGAPSAPVQLPATVQILDALTGFETVLTPVLQPGASAPDLAPQVLAGGQTMRITVAATPLAPCNATLGFANQNGVALGPSEPVSLTPGTATSLDLSASTVGLTLGRRIEVQPTVTPTAASSATGAPSNSVCQVTVETFESATGRTWNSQSTSVALPAQQTQ